ncbi:MAG: hypothetical protein ACK47V_04695 [Betaproteobacteria bacterium]|jgi:hypothetical protein
MGLLQPSGTSQRSLRPIEGRRAMVELRNPVNTIRPRETHAPGGHSPANTARLVKDLDPPAGF